MDKTTIKSSARISGPELRHFLLKSQTGDKAGTNQECGIICQERGSCLQAL